MGALWSEIAQLGPIGAVAYAIAIALIPVVVLRRKEPSSTAAWILALLFLPGLGATLFLLFGRDRVRIPAQWKQEADRELAERRRLRAALGPAPHAARLARLGPEVDDELFAVGTALADAEPTSGNSVELLVDGDATYSAIGAAIDAARRTVHAEYYLIRAGETAEWFKERLIAAARRGVTVRLLVDGYGSFWLPGRWLRALRQAGVEVAVFLPARLLLFQPMNLRNHRKIVVVDGEIAFTGGINVGDEYRGRHGAWRDTHLAVRGPAVAALARIFAEDWFFATRRGDAGRGALGGGAGRELPTDSIPPMEAHPGEATIAIVRSGPDIEGPARETIHRLFFSAITLAKKTVLVTTPYFIPDRAIVVALQTAALRGVDVRLLLPSRSNHRVVFQAARSFYEELLEAGVGLYEYAPGLIHAKTMVVDGIVALVGSANMDLRSFRLNFEVHAVIRHAETAQRLEEAFYADLAVSTRIDPELFRARPRALRVIEGAARLLSPLM